MTARHTMIAQNHGCAVDVFDYHIKLSVVEHVSDRQTAPSAAALERARPGRVALQNVPFPRFN